MISRRSLLQAAPLLVVPLPAMASGPKEVAITDMLKPMSGQEWRRFQRDQKRISNHFFLADTTSPVVAEFDLRNGPKPLKNTKRKYGVSKEELSVSQGRVHPEEPNFWVDSGIASGEMDLIIFGVISHVANKTGSFGQPHTGSQVSSFQVIPDDRYPEEVHVSSNGHIGFTLTDGGPFCAVVFPHLITAVWTD